MREKLKLFKLEQNCKFFIGGDMMFVNAIRGAPGEFAPSSHTGFNIYSQVDLSCKSTVGSSGGPSEVVMPLDRPQTFSSSKYSIRESSV